MLAVVVFFSFSTGVDAKQERGLRLDSNVLQMNVTGNDVHVGDVVRYSYESVADNKLQTINYSLSTKPIITKMKNGIGYPVRIIYRWSNWGIGAGGWGFGANGSTEGVVTSQKGSSNYSSYDFYVDKFYFTDIRFGAIQSCRL
ncbi:MAG: hypothetical protein Q8R26_02465 [bacterium]|nr:hypothetical protein [bacterium]